LNAKSHDSPFAKDASPKLDEFGLRVDRCAERQAAPVTEKERKSMTVASDRRNLSDASHRTAAFTASFFASEFHCRLLMKARATK
jgi:hypothetical protein